MISQDITYDDFDGNKVTKKFWFHLTKLEVMEVHLQDDLEEVANAKDAVRALRAMRRLMRYAVVQRHGDTVSKPDGIGDEFVASDAYSAFMFDLLESENAVDRMQAFIRGVAPHVAEPTLQDRLPVESGKNNIKGN